MFYEAEHTQPRLALNSQSCLSLPSAGTAGMAQPSVAFISTLLHAFTNTDCNPQQPLTQMQTPAHQTRAWQRYPSSHVPLLTDSLALRPSISSTTHRTTSYHQTF